MAKEIEYAPKPRSVTKEEALANPEQYELLNGGAIRDRSTGRLVGHTGSGPNQITKANAHAMLAKRREKGIIAQMRGLAAKEGIALPPDLTDEEILRGALDGIEAMTAHMKNVFMKSQNVRGLAEAYTKLVSPVVGQPSEDDEPVNESELRVVLREIAISARKIEQSNSSDIIDADIE